MNLANEKQNVIRIISFTALNHFTKAKVNSSWASKRGCITISRLQISQNYRFSPLFQTRELFHAVKTWPDHRNTRIELVPMWRWNNSVDYPVLATIILPWLNNAIWHGWHYLIVPITDFVNLVKLILTNYNFILPHNYCSLSQS